MIIVDETLPLEDLPAPFPARNVDVKLDADMRDSYDLKKEIGRGRFGTVYLCSCKKTGIKFAAKFVNTKRNQDRENVEREISIMKTLSSEGAHQKLIQLYDAFDMGKEMCLVLEVVQGGELFERVIDDDFELTERACAIFIKQICEGIEFIHSKNILHLDMKPENILCLSREGNRIKICDFGLARKYDPRKKLQVLFGTPEFVAPEVVNFEPISFGTDMWSIGVICYVLLSGLSPFMGHNYVETMTNVTHNKYDFDDCAFDDVSDDVKDFIERLLVLDKSSRMTPEQCLRHPWLRQVTSRKRAKKGEKKELGKANLKKYMSRRRWNKVVHTLTALKRMGANFEEKKREEDSKKNQDNNPSCLYVPNSLAKTTSSPNINISLSENTKVEPAEASLSPSHSPGFHRCQSTIETSDPFSGDLLAKTSVVSRSSNQLDTLYEENEGYYAADRKKELYTVEEDFPNLINFSSNKKAKVSPEKTLSPNLDKKSNNQIITQDNSRTVPRKDENAKVERRRNKSEKTILINEAKKPPPRQYDFLKSQKVIKELGTVVNSSKLEKTTKIIERLTNSCNSLQAQRRTDANSKRNSAATNMNDKEQMDSPESNLAKGEDSDRLNIFRQDTHLDSNYTLNSLSKPPPSPRNEDLKTIPQPTQRQSSLEPRTRYSNFDPISRSNSKLCKIQPISRSNFKLCKIQPSPLTHSQTFVNIAEAAKNDHMNIGLNSDKNTSLKKSQSFVINSKSSTKLPLYPQETSSDYLMLRDKTKNNPDSIVDQLLSQFKPDRRTSFGTLKPVKKQEKIEAVPSSQKRIIKPYVAITKEGLPRNSGSVKEMARRMTTKFTL